VVWSCGKGVAYPIDQFMAYCQLTSQYPQGACRSVDGATSAPLSCTGRTWRAEGKPTGTVSRCEMPQRGATGSP